MSVFYEKKDDKLCCHLDKDLVEWVHCHSELEIIICRKGSFGAYINSQYYTVNSGEMLIVFPNQIHSYINAEIGEYCVIIFSADYVPELKNYLLKNIPKNNRIILKSNPEINSITSKITNEYDSQSPFSSSVLIGYIYLLMAKILSSTEFTPAFSANDDLTVKVLLYCSENFSNKISLDDIAKALYVSPSKISSLLNSRLNISLPQLLNFIRISKACSLLKDTNTVITDIASTVGFGSLRSFNRAFLEIVGKTPSKFRLDSQNENKHN